MTIRFATESDAATILAFITKLAVYEKLEHEVVATEAKLQATLFGDKPIAEVLLLEDEGEPRGFALFFHSYSTFLAKPGIYLEDLFVLEEHRGKGYGTKLLAHLAKLAVQRDCGRLEWSVLNWNKPSIDFYKALGSQVQTEWQTHRLTGSALAELAQRSAP